MKEVIQLKPERNWRKKINMTKNDKKEFANKHHICNKEQKPVKCYFCEKIGHFQKDCLKCIAWFENKFKFSSFRNLTLNLGEFCYNF